MHKKCIILGSGNSISSGIKLGLSNYTENSVTFGINEAIKFFDCTAYTFGDWCAYLDRFDLYSKASLVIGKYDTHIGCKIEGARYCPKHEGVILLNSSSKYYGKDGLTKGLYSAMLTGMWTLNLAIALGFTKIYLCYDKKTEVFTNLGWKFFKDLNGNEMVLTRKSNGKTEWSKIVSLQQYAYNGIMKQFKAKGIDLLVTPDHPFYLESNKKYSHSISSDGYIHRTASTLNTCDYKIPKSFVWKGKNKNNFYLKDINKSIKIPMKDWVAFLGLYLSEGCVGSSKNGRHIIYIYQNHTKYQDDFILNILNKLPFKYYNTKRGWAINSEALYNYLKPLGLSLTKFIPLYYKNLSKDYLLILLKSLIFGDGHEGYKKSLYYFTSSKQLADDVQEIAYKGGYYSSIYKREGRCCTISVNPEKICNPAYTVYLNISKQQGNISSVSTRDLVFKNKIKDVYYNDVVYDLTAEKNHVIWVRRNNHCVWSGNCGFDNIAIDGRTHWYEGVKDAGQYFDYEGTPRTGVGFNSDGQYKTSMYDKDDDHINSLWMPFTQEKDVSIFNVSPQSRITVFPKLDYPEFFRTIKCGSQINHSEVQNEIRTILTPFNKG